MEIPVLSRIYLHDYINILVTIVLLSFEFMLRLASSVLPLRNIFRSSKDGQDSDEGHLCSTPGLISRR